MKSRKILLGSLGATLVAAAVLFASKTDETGVYQPRELSSTNQAEGIRGAFEYYNMIRKSHVTGEVDIEALKRAEEQTKAMAASGQRVEMTFNDHGPDNVAGRTRAILIDKDDDNIIYAGSVSGGIFKSINRGSTWNKLEGYEENYSVSSMCQTDNGHIYVATGHSEEIVFGGFQSGMNGDGVYVSTDNGVSFTKIPGSTPTGTSIQSRFINEIVASGNKVFIASADGLLVYENGSLSLLDPQITRCFALSISPDKEVIIAAGPSQQTFVSKDGGASFTNVSGFETDNALPTAGAGRIEFAISHERVDGEYYIYNTQCTAAGVLKGVFSSKNTGDTWERIAPANTGVPGAFAPFGPNSQGNYNQILTVVKGDPTAILFGGIDVWGKSDNTTWDLRSNWFLPKLSPIYVHADQHEMQWDSQGRLWLGTDGGVAFSDDNGNTFRESNRGYNVTQFYGIGASAHGDVMGGAQDNGTQVNYHNNHTWKEHDRFSGGDGFTCAMSFINRDIGFGTLYFGVIFRSADRGFNVNEYVPSALTSCEPGALFGSANPCGSFFTAIELYENPNDVNSRDTIIFTPTANLPAGTEISIPSLTSQQTISHTLTENVRFQDTLYANPLLTTVDTIVTDTAANSQPINLTGKIWSLLNGTMPLSIGDVLLVDGDTVVIANVITRAHYFGTNPGEPGEVVDMGQSDLLQNVSWDTVKVTDPFQSWLVLGLGRGQGIWLTRNALRFGETSDGFIEAGGGMQPGEQVLALEFSHDGNELYVGTSAGNLWRLSGLSDIYSPNSETVNNPLNWNSSVATTDWRVINSFNSPVLSVNVHKADKDLVVVSLGGTGGGSKIFRSTNATSASPNFTSIMGNMPIMPCLSILMDREDASEILVGTDFGLFRSQDGGISYSYVEARFGRSPIFDLMQNWRTWDEGNHYPGQIYVGTHGRGLWSTDEFLSAPEAQDNLYVADAITNLSVFPNPVVADANVSFDVQESGKGSLRVLNLRGQVVVDMQDVSLNAGKNILPIGLGDLSKGAYIITLTAGNDVKTTKFIKQ